MSNSLQRQVEELRRDRTPMLLLLASITAIALTITLIAYSVPEQTGSTEAAASKSDRG
jgi:hypothetical protein